MPAFCNWCEGVMIASPYPGEPDTCLMCGRQNEPPPAYTVQELRNAKRAHRWEMKR